MTRRCLGLELVDRYCMGYVVGVAGVLGYDGQYA